jgi:ethanolamine utilization microcompartment shell protein EutL
MAVDRLTDPAIAEGTLITLPPPERSQTKAGLAAAVREAEHGASDSVTADNDDERLVDYIRSTGSDD